MRISIKVKIFIIVILLGVNNTFSQQYFNNVYNINGPNIWSTSFSIIQNGNEYISAGQTGHPLNYYWNQIGILCLDSTGEKKWSKVIGDTICRYYSGYSNSFLKAKTNGFYLCGTKQCYEGSQTNNKGLLIKMSDSCEIEWEIEYGNKTLPGDTSNLFDAMAICQDNSLLLCGAQIIFTPGPDNNQFLLIKTDSLGNKLWERTYGLYGENRAYSVIHTSDGGYALGGWNLIINNYQSKDPIVIKTDSEGNQEWILNLGSEYKDDRAQLCEVENGIVAATTYADSATPGSDYSFSRINVIRLDLQGQEIWNKKYGESRKKNYIRALKNVNNNGYILSGYVGTYPGPWYSSWMLRIDSNGDSLWYREYSYVTGENSENRFYDMTPTSDNGFIACGKIIPITPDTGQMRAWIVKLDSLGCDTPGCNTGVWVAPLVKDENEMILYPNPAKNFLNCRLSVANCRCVRYLKIYDIYGRRQEEIRVPERMIILRIDVSAYTGGIYIAILKDQKKIITERKFVVLR